MFKNCFLGTLVGFLNMLLNGCLIIDFKGKNKFMLKIWQKLAFHVFLIALLFKLILTLSVRDQMYENRELELQVYILLSTTGVDLYFRNNGFEHINTTLGHVVEETDEERRPLFERKDNITNNARPRY